MPSAGLTAAVRGNLGVSDETGAFVDGKPWRLNIAVQTAAALQCASIGGEDVAPDFALHCDGANLDITDYFAMFTDGQFAVRDDVSFNTPVNDELAGEADVSFDADIARETVRGDVAIAIAIAVGVIGG